MATEDSSVEGKENEQEQQQEPQTEEVHKGAGDSIVGLPQELLLRHPLQSRWALWYLKADRNKEWEDCLKVFFSFLNPIPLLDLLRRIPTYLAEGNFF
ncbi:hypothetical protein ANCCAN_14432 [Ancylostoma caninum]|uniref:Uncharacterized protein n=1 Tax=Ancylostoma caninum TaxID=29170 RepID=A0A368G9G2_ANCCA|nr:hypothetical protein ANCCAN_14432 [Ancylostoma caninum]